MVNNRRERGKLDQGGKHYERIWTQDAIMPKYVAKKSAPATRKKTNEIPPRVPANLETEGNAIESDRPSAGSAGSLTAYEKVQADPTQ